MDVPARQLPDALTWEWISGELATLWQPFLLGSVVVGLVLGVIAYFGVMMYWRLWVSRQWARRKKKRMS